MSKSQPSLRMMDLENDKYKPKKKRDYSLLDICSNMAKIFAFGQVGNECVGVSQ